MIAFLKGVLAYSDMDSVIIDVNGVGYRLSVPLSSRGGLGAIGDEVKLYTVMAIREDSINLYGFATEIERELFTLLTTVNGVGPKVALSILSSLGPDRIRIAIATGDPSELTKASGVGKKTAQRIVLELKDKAGFFDSEDQDVQVNLSGSATGTGDEAIDALMALGFNYNEARRAVAKALGSLESRDISSEELIRMALKCTGSR